MKKLSKKLLLSGLAALTIYSGFNNIDISTTYAKVNYDVFDLEAHRGGRDVRPGKYFVFLCLCNRARCYFY